MSNEQNPDRTVHTSQGVKKRTSTRDNKRAFRIAVTGAVIALAAVLAFNFMAPRDRLEGPGESPTPSMTQGANQSGGPSGNGAVQQATPQRGDSPTAPGRESVGAPVGSTPVSGK